MKHTIAKIRALLDTLERDGAPKPEAPPPAPAKGTLAHVLVDTVDLLVPRLKPYEAAVYLYMFRHAFLKTGRPHVRVSQNDIRRAVTSAYMGSARGRKAPAGTMMSVDTARATLNGLARVGAIRQEGEPNRDGTLYRVFVPDEIDACREVKRPRPAAKPAPDSAADFYTVRENRQKVYARDGYRCQYCGKGLDRYTATLDHVRPVAAGGGHDLDNLVTVCRQCNSRKNAKPLGDFLAERAAKQEDAHLFNLSPRGRGRERKRAGEGAVRRVRA